LHTLTSAPPPVRPEGLLFIHRLKANKGFRGVILSHDPFGAYVHFVDERSRLCLGHDSCLFCERGIARRWKGYLAVCGLSIQTRPEILEVTQDLVSQIAAKNPDKKSLRGWEIHVKRGGSDNSRLLLEFLIERQPSLLLIPMPNMVPSLAAFFLQ